MLTKALTRMSKRLLTEALLRWVEFHDEVGWSHTLLAQAAARFLHRELSMGWSRWRESYAITLAEHRAWSRHPEYLWNHRRLQEAWGFFKELVSVGRRIQLRCVVWHAVYQMSSSFQNWRKFSQGLRLHYNRLLPNCTPDAWASQVADVQATFENLLESKNSELDSIYDSLHRLRAEHRELQSISTCDVSMMANRLQELQAQLVNFAATGEGLPDGSLRALSEAEAGVSSMLQRQIEGGAVSTLNPLSTTKALSPKTPPTPQGVDVIRVLSDEGASPATPEGTPGRGGAM